MGTVSYSAAKKPIIVNELRGFEVVVTPSASYATGGDTLPLASLGLKTIERVVQEGNVLFNPGISVRLGGTLAAPTLIIYDAQGTEVANASNNSTRLVSLWLLGRGG